MHVQVIVLAVARSVRYDVQYRSVAVILAARPGKLASCSTS
jgi:hypothetical protein